MSTVKERTGFIEANLPQIRRDEYERERDHLISRMHALNERYADVLPKRHKLEDFKSAPVRVRPDVEP